MTPHGIMGSVDVYSHEAISGSSENNPVRQNGSGLNQQKTDQSRIRKQWKSSGLTNLRAAIRENVLSCMYAHRRLKSACASALTDQRYRCPHEHFLRPWSSKMRPMKILIRLRECAVWSESSLGAHVRRYVFWCSGKYYKDRSYRKSIIQQMSIWDKKLYYAYSIITYSTAYAPLTMVEGFNESIQNKK